MTKLTTKILILISTSLLALGPAYPANSHLSRGFLKMEPRTRSLQICNNKGSREISKEKEFSRLDRVVVDAMSTPSFDEHVISGDGGAFRLKGQWHQFQFKCILAKDNMSALSFTYHVGEAIPEDQWEKFGLWR
ncbi:DUF930 domain-containing protein [Microvirga sp. 2TAF3]|uniref:DUF930 domain-containing protein n=1 Tax=Microvirga sp. 2TAF3 TaxID=3233014 RepID=UPI003F9DCE8A